MNEMNEKRIRYFSYFSVGVFPLGCKFNKNGVIDAEGKLRAAFIVNEQLKKNRRIIPCNGCMFYNTCEKEGRFKPRQDRLDTESLDTRPLRTQEIVSMATILKSPIDDAVDWMFDPDTKDLEIPWIVRVIRKRIIGENLKIEITEQAYLIMMVLVQGNPGRAMFVLHKIGNFFEKMQSQQWLVTSDVLTAGLFPFGFPTDKAFNKWWKDQKMPQGSNRVDIFPNEWRKGDKNEEMRRDDVFKFTYKPGISEKSKLGDCFNGILVAKEYAPNKLYLEDTYWKIDKQSHSMEELRKIGTLKLICNLNDVFPISKKEYDKYKDNVKYSFLIWGNTMEFFIRKDVVNIPKYMKKGGKNEKRKND